MAVSNNTVHNKTKYTPNEIFYSTQDKLYKKVEKNTYDKFNNKRNLDFNFSKHEKCLLYNNFSLVKQKNKYGFFYLIKIK